MENTISNYQFLTPNLFTTVNETEILDYLVDNNQFPKQFNTTQVISFLQNEDFYLILFMVSPEGKRGFVMYKVFDFSMHLEEMYQLSFMFGELMKTVEDNYPYRMAKYKIEQMIGMASTMRVLFHKKEVEEEVLRRF
jgi:hypothetical protein